MARNAGQPDAKPAIGNRPPDLVVAVSKLRHSACCRAQGRGLTTPPTIGFIVMPSFDANVMSVVRSKERRHEAIIGSLHGLCCARRNTEVGARCALR
jgi:hypothetical protein